VIRRSPEDVFEFCSDLRRELQWNPKVKYLEKLTDGPVGVGTRYRARQSNSGPTTVEVVQFRRLHRWETSAQARGMGIGFRGTVNDAAPGARYSASLELHPKGLAWLVAPLACWPCAARTGSTCTASGRRLSPARLGRPSRAAATYGLRRADQGTAPAPSVN
jgi:Polyketide cyclase / dehydrase and lipid transport